MVIFDSRSEFFRYPQGAVSEGDKISVKIYIKRSLACTPKLIAEKRHDYNREYNSAVNMSWIGAHKEYDLYGCDFHIDESGNYFYYFQFDGCSIENPYPETHQLLVCHKEYETPDWIKGGIIYHIFVDRFYKEKINTKNDGIVVRHDWGGTPHYLPDENGKILNNDFFGGNLDGIIKKLPYLEDLGVSCIYLSPVFDAHSNHKYDVGDYLSIDSMFGDKDTLKSLCREASARGISVILDLVLSHTGDDSVYFNKYGRYNSVGAYQSKDSPYFEWYTFTSWNDEYNCWWDIKILPALNKENEDYKDFIFNPRGVARYYLKSGIAGYRLDVADELPNEFLNELHASVKSENKNAVIIGEVWEDAADKYSYGSLKEYFLGNQLDSVTNYPLRSAIIEYVKTGDCSMLYETMGFIAEKYPKQAVDCLMNILGTHDTPRILTVLGSSIVPNSKEEMAAVTLSEDELEDGIKRLKIAALLQMTLPGVPCIYYGDEAGMEGWADPFCRRCFPWENINEEIKGHYKFLSGLRKSSRLFVDGKYKCLIHDNGVFAFERYDGSKKIVIAMNMSKEPITINFKNNICPRSGKAPASTFTIESGDYFAGLR